MPDPAIEILHVGSASRDLTEDDPRGWRLGGGVTYAALTTARLGLRTAAVVGADSAAAAAHELDLLRQAGVELHFVVLDESPVFRNVETPGGRVQACLAPGHPLMVGRLPPGRLDAAAWSLVPVAGEIDDTWTAVVPDGVRLAVGWQGWLRELAAGRDVQRRPPAPSTLVRRANLVGVSRHDLMPGTRPASLRSMLGPDAELLVTDGGQGGELLRMDDTGGLETWRYDAIAPDNEVDPTGAGDVFLGALLACVVRPGTAGSAVRDIGVALAFAAAAASLVVERPGLHGVPDRAAVFARLERGRPGRRRRGRSAQG